MSTVKATNFQHPSASAAGITLGSDGSVVLPSGFTGGLGTNVVQTVKTDTFSASVASGGISGDITGLTVTITPSSASSKVLVLFTVQLGFSDTQDADVILYKDGSPSDYCGSAASNRTRSSSGASRTLAHTTGTAQGTWLDSPATTSAITYSLRAHHSSGSTATIYVNRSGTDTDTAVYIRTVSSITAIEVAA